MDAADVFSTDDLSFVLTFGFSYVLFSYPCPPEALKKSKDSGRIRVDAER